MALTNVTLPDIDDQEAEAAFVQQTDQIVKKMLVVVTVTLIPTPIQSPNPR
jgi:hypothetical protein